ncbi:MAG: hypothetical protein ABWX74_11475 [Aeromicrobium sp.]
MPQHRTPTRPEIARRLLVAHRLNLSLGISVAAANVLGYASIVVISASFGPADFGAVGAMTSLGVIAGIPAGTLMVITAGRVGRGEKVPWAYALGLAVGLVELLLITALSPVLMDVFDLDSWWPLLWLGLALVPATMSGGQQGVLLGSSRLGRLAVLFLVSGVARVAAAAVCIVAEPTVGGAYFFWLIASTVGLVVGHVLCHGLEPLHGQVRGLLRQASALGTASFGLLALITLTSVDTIFARHFLSAYDSGIYAVASMFAKVIFWGTQFIAMVVVPRLAQRSEHFLILKAYAAVLAISVPAVAVLGIDPTFWLSLLGLQDYHDAAGLLVRFAALGILWSLIQVSIFADMSGGRNQMTAFIWAGLAVQTLLTVTWLDSGPDDIWLAAFIAAALVTAAALVRMTWVQVRHSRPQPEPRH